MNCPTCSAFAWSCWHRRNASGYSADICTVNHHVSEQQLIAGSMKIQHFHRKSWFFQWKFIVKSSFQMQSPVPRAFPAHFIILHTKFIVFEYKIPHLYSPSPRRQIQSSGFGFVFQPCWRYSSIIFSIKRIIVGIKSTVFSIEPIILSIKSVILDLNRTLLAIFIIFLCTPTHSAHV